MPIGRLHVITNLRESRDDPLPMIRRVLEAGAPVVQVRAKGVSDRELFELTSRVVDVCAAHGELGGQRRAESRFSASRASSP